MKQQSNSDPTSSAYNKSVRAAYFQLLKATKQLLATIERHELRCTLQRQDREPIVFGSKVHEIITPLIYLSLECNDGETLTIHWGIEQLIEDSDYSVITSRFVRSLYKLTASENTSINIESCINTDYIITNCSELYEVVEDNNKLHTFTLIKHNPIGRRKLQAVA